MKHYTNIPDLRQVYGFPANLASAWGLWIAKRVVSTISTESWISRLLASFDAAEERFECQVNSGRYILKYLGVNGSQGWSGELQRRQGEILIIECKSNASGSVNDLALLKEMVVQPATFLKSLEHLCRLALSWQKQISERFMHSDTIAQIM